MRFELLVVMLGGAIGSGARYAVARWFAAQPWAQGFPYGTLAVNVSGSFVLGVAAVILLERLPPEARVWFLLLGTGFCGGYTTFSTFEWETLQLLRDGRWVEASLYVGASVAAGFLGVLLGVLVASGR